MDLVSPSEHLCYVRCAFCSTVLAVGVPSKRLMDTVTVKCGHCNHLSFLSPRPPVPADSQHPMGFQCHCNGCRSHQPSPPSSSSSSSTSNEQMIPSTPSIVKPPEKKHRLPSAYNRFMKEEIQRIKAAKPDIPHREAFSMAAKNWAKCDPRGTTTATPATSGFVRTIDLQPERTNSFLENFGTFKQPERYN